MEFASSLRDIYNGENRAETFLKACLELLEKQKNSGIVLNLLNETVHYDEADCDGYCLMDDIQAYLEIGE